MTRPHWETPPPEEALPLFAASARAPSQAHSETSRAAAESLDGNTLNALQRRVLDLLRVTPGGLTDEEIASRLAMNPSTERPRRIELARRGLVVKAGARKTASGRNADVWTVATTNQTR
jgi:DNA-binding NarL/FixJ family response regulator